MNQKLILPLLIASSWPFLLLLRCCSVVVIQDRCLYDAIGLFCFGFRSIVAVYRYERKKNTHTHDSNHFSLNWTSSFECAVDAPEPEANRCALSVYIYFLLVFFFLLLFLSIERDFHLFHSTTIFFFFFCPAIVYIRWHHIYSVFMFISSVCVFWLSLQARNFDSSLFSFYLRLTAIGLKLYRSFFSARFLCVERFFTLPVAFMYVFQLAHHLFESSIRIQTLGRCINTIVRIKLVPTDTILRTINQRRQKKNTEKIHTNQR